jgi:hypothetical protein
MGEIVAFSAFGKPDFRHPKWAFRVIALPLQMKIRLSGFHGHPT